MSAEVPRTASPKFADALEAAPATARLGDVTLRYEPSMLVGETPPPRRTWRPRLAVAAGALALIAALATSLAGGALVRAALLVALGAGALWGAEWLRRRERWRRRFVLNFETLSLRLDFVTPIAGYARTLIVPFDDVHSVELQRQVDGAQCLTVDFVDRHQGSCLLREVLVAHVDASQSVAAERVHRMLEAALGVGSAREPLVADTAPGGREEEDLFVDPHGD
jgi:hypothetical protein